MHLLQAVRTRMRRHADTEGASGTQVWDHITQPTGWVTGATSQTDVPADLWQPAHTDYRTVRASKMVSVSVPLAVTHHHNRHHDRHQHNLYVRRNHMRSRPVTSFRRRGFVFHYVTNIIPSKKLLIISMNVGPNSSLTHMRAQTHALERTHGMNA